MPVGRLGQKIPAFPISASFGGTGLRNSGTLTFTGNASITGINTGDQTITLTSDVTGSGTGSFATTISANAVTYAKFQQVNASSLVGNPTGSTANATNITLGSTLAFSGSALQTNAISGDVTSSSNSFATTLATVNSNVGSFTNANITVNAKGLITAASNGTGGSGGGIDYATVSYCGAA